MIMTQAELNDILEKHKKWLNNEPGGERANLSHCDLRHSDLSDSNLRHSDLRYSDLRHSNLSYSNLSHSNLSGCDLRHSDLYGCDLSGCDLRDSDLDYSCLPLWCGSLHAHFDDRHIAQIVYHAVKAGLASPNVSDEVKAELRKMAPLANRFHHAEECGVIEE